MSTLKYSYVGSELPLFARAVNWKRYWRSHVERWLGDRVLEVGAGIGGTTELLCRRDHRQWLCLEPDPRLADELRQKIDAGAAPGCCTVRVGTVADLSPAEKFDTILYIDVIEHVEDDRGELARAANHLADGGAMIVLSPAHPVLMSEFDRAVGHFRRYTRRMLDDAMPPGLEPVKLIYLDSVGSLASLFNRFVLRSPHPTAAQIRTWDRWMVSASRWIDPVLRYRVGKSVIGVYRNVAKSAESERV